MIGNIYIDGEIGETETGVGVMLIDVMTQVKAQPNATSFDVIVNSVGGCVEQGWKIANYIKSLGIPTNGIGKEIVASIATPILCSCDTRQMLPNTKFMMHLPMGEMGQGRTADEIEMFGKRVREEEDKLCKFYSELMGIDKDTVKSLISTDTYLTAEQLATFGITTKEPTKIVAKAYFNSNTNKQMSNLTTEEAEGLFGKLEAKIKALLTPKEKIVNKVLQDANGVSLDFEDVAEDATPVVGDKATVDGQPADTEYLMPSGETWVFVGGELTEIKPVEEANEEMEALKSDNAEQATLIEALKSEAVEKDEVISNIQKEVTVLKSKITSKLKVDKKEQKEVKQKGGSRSFLKKD